jgi:hypothetical protein
MATQYTPKLGLALPVQGELDGTWGDTVNNSITSLIEEAIAGRSVLNNWAANALAITTTNGAASNGRSMFLQLDDAAGISDAGTVTVPAQTKMFVVFNNTSYAVTVQASGGTGVVVPTTKTAILYCDGTNIKDAVDSIAGALNIGGALAVAGATTALSTLAVTGNLSVNTDKFTVDAATGNTVVAGTLTSGAAFGTTYSASQYMANSNAVVTGNLTATDMTNWKGQKIVYTDTGGGTIALPVGGSADIPIGTSWSIINAQDTADLVFSAQSGVTINIATGTSYQGTANTAVTLQQGGLAEIMCVAANTFIIFGAGIS